jgi:large subunit ribosomal protein L23
MALFEKKETTSNDGWAFMLITAPHVTEKSASLSAVDQYVFKVPQSVNKHQIRKAIEQLYKVTVIRVQTIRLPGKERRVGRFTGFTPGFKKAVVRLKSGDVITTAKA